MSDYSFETIEQMLLKCAAEGGEPELGFACAARNT